MAKRSWPFGVTSWDDTVKFAQLLFGVDVAFENYAERLPHRSNKSFLLFAKGACAEGRPFFEIGDFIAPQLEEIQQWEENVRNNNARPTKSQQMLKADGWTVYYWSAQVTRAPCLCRSIFGADAHQKHVPTSSAMWNKHLALKTKEQEMKQRWQPKILLIQDEISLVPAAVENMMLYRSMRARQDEGLDPASYFHPGELMGHIPILLIASDFLQIKPANEISLADNLEELIRKMPHRVQTEHHAAQAALMTIDTVIHLKKSKRFLDAHLPEITTAMRTCTPAAPLSEDHLAQLRTRKIENCKKELTTDLFKHGHVIGMYWENIARSMVERANRDAQDLDVPLFCLQAADQRHSRKNKAIDKQLTHQLLTVPNPHRTGKLQGMLLVHENMVVRLADVLAPHLGLVKDKLAVVVKVDLHHEDQKRLDRREPGFCHFFPDYMAKGIWVKLLKGKNSPMEDALLQTWEEKFQNVADHTTDAKTLFFVELVHAEFKIDLKLGEETEKIEVIRWQFPLLHGMLRTAYSAQGLTLDGGVLVDLRRGGGLEDADWWLAIYVMLTRARKLKNLILLGFTEQVEELLRRGPPTYLRELTDKLETKAASTLERLQSWPVYDALQASWHSALPVGPNRFWLKRSGGGIGLTRCSTCGT